MNGLNQAQTKNGHWVTLGICTPVWADGEIAGYHYYAMDESGQFAERVYQPIGRRIELD